MIGLLMAIAAWVLAGAGVIFLLLAGYCAWLLRQFDDEEY
jgi:hypothetical protein